MGVDFVGIRLLLDALDVARSQFETEGSNPAWNGLLTRALGADNVVRFLQVLGNCFLEGLDAEQCLDQALDGFEVGPEDRAVMLDTFRRRHPFMVAALNAAVDTYYAEKEARDN